MEINEKEMRATQFQYEAMVMAEAARTMEDAASGLQRQSKEEQQQLKEAFRPCRGQQDIEEGTSKKTNVLRKRNFRKQDLRVQG